MALGVHIGVEDAQTVTDTACLPPPALKNGSLLPSTSRNLVSGRGVGRVRRTGDVLSIGASSIVLPDSSVQAQTYTNKHDFQHGTSS